MTLVTTQLAGYLDDPYLTGPYLGGSNYGNSGLQFQALIDRQLAEGLQFAGFIGTTLPAGLQFLGSIEAQRALGLQLQGIIETALAQGLQYQGLIEAQLAGGLQFSGTIEAQKAGGLQFFGQLSTQDAEGIQFRALIDQGRASGLQFRVDSGIVHLQTCDEAGYLMEPYLVGPYLTAHPCAHSGLQFQGFIATTRAHGLQFRGTIDYSKVHGLQFRGIINAVKAYGLQFLSVKAAVYGLQFNAVLYNHDNLRILCDFPSRGTSGVNWTSNSVAPGDFSENNLNTDVVEQVYRTNGAITGITLDCDTEVPQGVFLDTLAILNHNLTSSASVVLLGSQDPSFATIGTTLTLQARPEEMYYIAAEFPTQGFRYWRFQIDDVTNADGHLQIGTIVFGNSLIFQGECFVDEVDYGLKDFADTVRTAGHTNASNSRAIKKSLTLDFRSLDFTKGNFRSMRAMFREDRTIFKCLWIPTPDPDDQEYTARFAVFSKMVTIPREKHKSHGRTADYVGFTVELDESL